MPGIHHQLRRLRHFVNKGLDRGFRVKVSFLAAVAFQGLFLLCVAFFLPWAANGGDLLRKYDLQTLYFAIASSWFAIASMFSAVMGCLTANLYQVCTAALIDFVLSLWLLLALGLGVDTRQGGPGPAIALIVCIILMFIVYAALSLFMSQSFGWSIHIRFGSSKGLLRGFRWYCIGVSSLQGDMVLTVSVIVAGFLFIFNGIEGVFAGLGAFATIAWLFITFLACRREWGKILLLIWPFGLVLPTYLLYKVFDVTMIRPGRLPRSFIVPMVVSSCMLIAARILAMLSVWKLRRYLGKGLRHRLDEIGVWWGGQEGRRRRKNYKTGSGSDGRAERKARTAKELLSFANNKRGLGRDDHTLPDVHIAMEARSDGEESDDQSVEQTRHRSASNTSTGRAARSDSTSSSRANRQDSLGEISKGVQGRNSRRPSQSSHVSNSTDGRGKQSALAKKLAAQRSGMSIVLLPKPAASTEDGSASEDPVSTQEVRSSMPTPEEAVATARLAALDKRRLALLKQGLPSGPGAELVRQYRDLAASRVSDATSKLATHWAKELLDKLVRRAKADADSPRSKVSLSRSNSAEAADSDLPSEAAHVEMDVTQDEPRQEQAQQLNISQTEAQDEEEEDFGCPSDGASSHAGSEAGSGTEEGDDTSEGSGDMPAADSALC